MTARERQIIRAQLDALHDLNGGQFTDIQLHAAANLKLDLRGQPVATLAEFNAALRLADLQGWVTGIVSRFGGKKWNLNDAGEAARLEFPCE